ncbi:MAG: thioredoxin domain-containing protein [Nitrosopumilus sp.]
METKTIDSSQHKHTNHLINETSPYLLQHAHNPVNWYPWGDEALEKAARENKLILVSIGYSACHWCHVMEHESFEDEEVAKIMNDNFVCIKVDREERPDIDQIHMNAVHLMNQGGGWPLNCFTLPDGKPFFGGTYFSNAQWRQVLKKLHRNIKITLTRSENMQKS